MPADPASTPSHTRQRVSAILGVTASVTILCVALWFLHSQLAELSLATLAAHVQSVPRLQLFGAIACAACSYFVLTGYDGVALRYVGQRLPYGAYALTAFMAYAVGHNVGVAALSGGSIRYRMYSLRALSASDIARIVVFVTITFGLGASGLLGAALVTMPATQTAVLSVPPGLVTAVGGLLLAVPCVYVAASFLTKSPITIYGWQLSVPRPSIAGAQILVSIVDLSFAAATLYVLLEPLLPIGFVPFLGIYLLAMAAGLVSSVPGGIGVFEATLVALLPGLPAAELLGNVILYRLIYYLGPLVIALALLTINEARQHGHVLRQSSERVSDLLSTVTPQVVSAMVFLAGIVLLLSGASPAVEERLKLIADGMPLPLLELSHLMGSVIGVGLLVLATGLYHRLRTAYLATLAALTAGIVISLLKGLDYEEALILSIVMLALWVARDRFHRLGSLIEQRFSAARVAAILCVLCVTTWVGLVTFRHVPYSDRLWWQFAFDAQAPRTLRAGVLAAVTALAFGAWKLLRTAPRLAVPRDGADLERVRRAVESAQDTTANLALLGDKRFLWSADGRAFVMYQISGESWIAMGDPVGPLACHEELIWSFRELVDQHVGRPVFYQVSNRSLPLYIDLGLSLSKLGEDAKVPLEGFSLQGSERADLRQSVNRARKGGASFEIVPRAEVPGIIGELRRISTRWLEDKATAEKGFSLGSFSERYIENFDCAVVRANGELVAFANIWLAPAGAELSIDLMRYEQRAPKSVMDYLLAELMLWGAANGYRWFNLGMAPLSGMEHRALAPLWHKLGHLIFTHGEPFYNFEGLRSYKEKFHPEWHARYLACPSAWWNLPWALLDSSRLISGGVAQILTKR